MITNKDLEISNTSFTKKDFYQIYPEILDLVTKITERWNPDSSNESDPGVVLLKLLAFIADKNNYNIDKNILECFMPSATQDQSMRKLCDMMGYGMKYYQSATTDISFEYTGTGFDGTSPDITGSIKLPAFDTIITNEDGDINYVLTKDVNLASKYEFKTASAIEGTLCEAITTSPNVITLTNLDDNNRFYLPETNIAENGIFIRTLTVYNEGTSTYGSIEDWNKVDNLNTQVAGSSVWKFGYDSKQNLPYIEFPDDIGDLIGLGLNIRYIRTTGVNGNVSANTLTTIAGGTATDDLGNTVSLDPVDNNSVIIITNASASSDGVNPETLDEAYSNFKKTVGTFDTLVTCRDYANKIYEMVSSSDNTTPLVSNMQASDIRDDLSRSNNIMTYNDYGLGFLNKSVTETVDGVTSDLINHFDLVFYPFTPITGAYNRGSFVQSFQPYIGTMDDIISGLENYKTISHQISTPDLTSSSEPYCLKNYYDLSAKITTTYKVSTTEKKSILNHIYSALYKKFNLRNIDFGEEIPFDSILTCIQNADTRIKNVSLAEPTLSPKLMFADGSEVSIGGEPDTENLNRKYYIDLLAKNIVAGRVPLFKYNELFDYEFGQSQFTWATSSSTSDSFNVLYGKDSGGDGITYITTKVEITPETTSSLANSVYTTVFNRTLKSNEVIQMMAPSLSTEITYPVNINYNFYKSDAHSGSAVINAYISAGTEYQLVGTDVLYINYTDTDDAVQNIKYEAGTIIKPNFDLYDSQYVKNQGKISWAKTSGYDSSWSISGMFSLGTNEQIEKRNFVKTNLQTPTKCYWILNNSVKTGSNIVSTISFDSNGEYILKDGEYFFYTNNAETELVTLGSGTKIKKNAYLGDWVLSYNTSTAIDKDTIANKGIGAFVSTVWKIMNFSTDAYATLQEMQFVTLTAEDELVSTTSSGAITELNNSWASITGASYILSGGSPTPLPTFSISGTNMGWAIRSRLDFNLGPKLSQQLLDGQSFSLQKDTTAGSIKTIEPKSNYVSATESTTLYPYLRCNYLLQQAGGENISTTITQVSDSTETQINDLDVMVFKYSDPTYTTTDTPSTTKILDVKTIKDIYTKINWSSAKNIIFDAVVPTGYQDLLMLYYTPANTAVTTLSTTSTYLNWYNGTTSAVSSLTLKKGINIISVSTSCTLTLARNTETSGTIVIDSLRVISTENSGIDMSTLTLTTQSVVGQGTTTEPNYLLQEIKNISTVDNQDIFYYSAHIDSSLLIDSDDMSDPHVWYDYNNVCNKFVVSELYAGEDTDTPFPNITLTKTSLL